MTGGLLWSVTVGRVCCDYSESMVCDCLKSVECDCWECMEYDCR